MGTILTRKKKIDTDESTNKNFTSSGGSKGSSVVAKNSHNPGIRRDTCEITWQNGEKFHEGIQRLISETCK